MKLERGKKKEDAEYKRTQKINARENIKVFKNILW